jgi:hypothetical protein
LATLSIYLNTKTLLDYHKAGTGFATGAVTAAGAEIIGAAGAGSSGAAQAL